MSVSTKTININPLSGVLPGSTFSTEPNRTYDIRRKIKTAKSSIVDMEFGNNVITSDITNVYNDSDERMYVASNSLPSYTINKSITQSIIPNATANVDIQGYNPNTLKYSIISFSQDVGFITGDEISYSAQGTTIPGLEEGTYFVEVIAKNQIRLYRSRSFIPVVNFIEFEPLPANTGTHTFSLIGTLDQKISPQKLLKEFPLEPNLENSDIISTTPNPTGLLINGVEILNYKSNDQIYFGPIEDVKILNQDKIMT